MNHIDNDTLLKFVLELLDDQENKRIQEHLSQCERCRATLENTQRQIDIIGSIDPEIDALHYPLPRAQHISFLPVLKAAALVLIGFVVGVGTANLHQPEQVNVVPQHIELSSPQSPAAAFTSCESLDIYTNFQWSTNQSQDDSLGT